MLSTCYASYSSRGIAIERCLSVSYAGAALLRIKSSAPCLYRLRMARLLPSVATTAACLHTLNSPLSNKFSIYCRKAQGSCLLSPSFGASSAQRSLTSAAAPTSTISSSPSHSNSESYLLSTSSSSSSQRFIFRLLLRHCRYFDVYPQARIHLINSSIIRSFLPHFDWFFGADSSMTLVKTILRNHKESLSSSGPSTTAALLEQMLHVIRTLALAIHQHTQNQNFPMDAQSLAHRLQNPSPSTSSQEPSEPFSATLSDEKSRRYVEDLEALVKEVEDEEAADQEEGGLFVDEAEEDREEEKKLKAQLKGLSAAEKLAKCFFHELRYPFVCGLDLVFIREERRILNENTGDVQQNIRTEHIQQEDDDDEDEDDDDDEEEEDEDNEMKNADNVADSTDENGEIVADNEDSWDPRYLRSKVALQLSDFVHVDEQLSNSIRIHSPSNLPLDSA